MADQHQPETYGAGVRLPYAEMPNAVKGWIAGRLGAAVTRVRDHRGGFSPGVAASVVAENGDGLFIKAVTDAINVDSLTMYRNERDRTTPLPDLPGLLKPDGATELLADGHQWIVMTFPLLAGEPPRHPWTSTDARRVLDTINDIGEALTPSPSPEDPRLTREMLDFFTGWQTIVETNDDDPWPKDPWITDRLDLLVALESEVQGELPGDTLTHFDLRADNIVITPDQVWLVDWAHARNAARWVDTTLLVGDFIASRADRADGGEINIPQLLREHPRFAAVPTRLQFGVLAGLAATLHVFSRKPPQPGLPTIREWQSRIADTMIDFVRRNLDEAVTG